MIEKAIYLGVVDYGKLETNKYNKDTFRYRFLIDKKEKVFYIDNGVKNINGEYEYPIQNRLKEGYSYSIFIYNDVVVNVKELEWYKPNFIPVVSGIPGKRTITNFLKTAMMPIGTTLYVYGGGWNWQDNGSSIQTRTIGVSSDWVRFFNEQDENYTFKSIDREHNNYYYAGLDCSGYVGWVIYNTFKKESGLEGYVTSSTLIAKKLSNLGWGIWNNKIDNRNVKPGDIISIDGHVWISLGTCEDGSVVIVHSTPSKSRTGQPGGGVQISALGDNKSCEAYRLADKYMSKYYRKWYKRYNILLREPDLYFKYNSENAGLFSWNTEVMEDPDKFRDMTPSKVLSFIYGNKNIYVNS